MKTPRILLILLILAARAYALTNSYFESTPFSTGWTIVGAPVVTPGFVTGSTQGTRFTASGQSLAQTTTWGAEWSVENYFAIRSTTSRAYSLILGIGGQNGINMRYGEGGNFAVFSGQGAGWIAQPGLGALLASTDANANGSLNDAGDTKNVYRIRVTGHAFGTAGWNYTIELSEANGTTFTRSVSGLTLYQNLPGSGASITSVTYGTVNGSNPGFWLDEVKSHEEIPLPPTIRSFLTDAGNIGGPGLPASAQLSWIVENGDSASISGVGNVATTGTTTVAPGSATTYTLTATRNGALTPSTATVTIAVNAAQLPPVLNEFSADGTTTLLDEDGARPDWIELRNPNAFSLNLAGYALTDTVTAGDDWVFPLSNIPPNGYLIVFASAKNRAVSGSPLHTNFSINADGEYLALLAPGGTLVQQFPSTYPTPLKFPNQIPTISYGLDSTGAAKFFSPHTPGAANSPGLDGQVADTNFSVKRGVYTTPQTVAITTLTPGATIRYTTNGSTPTETNGIVYSAPLNIANQTVIRARAFAPNLAPSNTDTQTYIFHTDVLAQGATPAGWPATGVNGQVLRYGINTTLAAQYTTPQIVAGLTQLPSVSLVTDQANLTDPTTGIYVNSLNKGDAWERPASVELIYPDGVTDGFHINAGLRIRGGYSRNDQFPKHGFRLNFSRTYGESSLKHDLFGGDAVKEFKQIDMRTEQNYNWSTSTGTENTAVREVFCRDLQRAMGQDGARSKSFHLYINGLYWGLYMWEERPFEDHAANYHGGSPEDYDVVQTSNHSLFTYELAAGTIDAWQTTWNLTRACAANPTNANYFALLGRDANGVRVPAMPVYVDPEHLAAYMLLFYYTGDGDAPLSNFLTYNRANNWRGFRNRFDEKGWQFFAHDCEHTVLASSWVPARATANTTGGANRSNFTYSNSEWLHEDLATNAEYRLKIADVAQKHLFNDGALTQSKALGLFNARAAEINQAIIADVVRWGTNATNHTQAQWLSRLESIRTGFFPTRAATVISQLKTRGFYPNVNPPVFSQRGGQVASGFGLVLSNGGQSGTMYFTTNGSDPRAVGGALAVGATAYTAPMTINALTTVRTRFQSTGGEWSALDESTFSVFPAASAANLVISKIHYHPADPLPAENPTGLLTDSAFEFVELLNKSASTIDIHEVSFDRGITFSFSGSAINTLAPGARVLVVANPTAFDARYGSGLPVAGTYSGTLSNSGETVRIVNGAGVPICEVTYADSAGWPESADGTGHSLVLIDPAAAVSNPANWRSSVSNGAPATSDSVAPFTGIATADTDADGIPALVEHFLGTDDAIPNPLSLIPGTTPDGRATLTFTRRIAVDDLTYNVETTTDLAAAWLTIATRTVQQNNNDGTFTETWTAPTVAPAQFLRIRVTK
jgi:hypothetical protein